MEKTKIGNRMFSLKLHHKAFLILAMGRVGGGGGGAEVQWREGGEQGGGCLPATCSRAVREERKASRRVQQVCQSKSLVLCSLCF